jgi:hypothetical protein
MRILITSLVSSNSSCSLKSKIVNPEVLVFLSSYSTFVGINALLIKIDSIFYLIENISSNGTATQSSDYFWKDKQIFLTADLAITGGPTHHF